MLKNDQLKNYLRNYQYDSMTQTNSNEINVNQYKALMNQVSEMKNKIKELKQKNEIITKEKEEKKE